MHVRRSRALVSTSYTGGACEAWAGDGKADGHGDAHAVPPCTAAAPAPGRVSSRAGPPAARPRRWRWQPRAAGPRCPRPTRRAQCLLPAPSARPPCRAPAWRWRRPHALSHAPRDAVRSWLRALCCDGFGRFRQLTHVLRDSACMCAGRSPGKDGSLGAGALVRLGRPAVGAGGHRPGQRLVEAGRQLRRAQHHQAVVLTHLARHRTRPLACEPLRGCPSLRTSHEKHAEGPGEAPARDRFMWGGTTRCE